MSDVNVHVFVEESQVPTVEQSPPSFTLRITPDVFTVPLGAPTPSESATAFPVAVFPVNVCPVEPSSNLKPYWALLFATLFVMILFCER